MTDTDDTPSYFCSGCGRDFRNRGALVSHERHCDAAQETVVRMQEDPEPQQPVRDPLTGRRMTPELAEMQARARLEVQHHTDPARHAALQALADADEARRDADSRAAFQAQVVGRNPGRDPWHRVSQPGRDAAPGHPLYDDPDDLEHENIALGTPDAVSIDRNERRA